MKVYHEDFEYAKLACEAYKRFQDKEKIFYIDKEIDLEMRIEIREADNWLEEITNRNRETILV